MDHRLGNGFIYVAMHHLTGCSHNELRILRVFLQNLVSENHTPPGELLLPGDWTRFLLMSNKQIQKALAALEKRGIIVARANVAALDIDKVLALAKTHREKLLRCICEIEQKLPSAEKEQELRSSERSSIFKVLADEGIIPSPLDRVCQIGMAVKSFASCLLERPDVYEDSILRRELDAIIACLVGVRGRFPSGTASPIESPAQHLSLPLSSGMQPSQPLPVTPPWADRSVSTGTSTASGFSAALMGDSRM